MNLASRNDNINSDKENGMNDLMSCRYSHHINLVALAEVNTRGDQE